MAFGNVDLGTAATQEISPRNTGNSNIAISSESIKGTGLTEAWYGWSGDADSRTERHVDGPIFAEVGRRGQLDGSAVTGTSYTDSNVSAGEYYYLVAAINSEGAESAYSVQAAVSVL